MHALYYLDTLAGGGFGIVFPKTQTRRRGAILSDLQTKEVLLKLAVTQRLTLASCAHRSSKNPCVKAFCSSWNTHDWARGRVWVLWRAASWWQASDWTGTISTLKLCRGNKLKDLVSNDRKRIILEWSCCNTHIKVVADLGPTCGGLPCIEKEFKALTAAISSAWMHYTDFLQASVIPWLLSE